MKRLLSLLLLSSFLLSACGAFGATPAEDATPTYSTEDIRATADAMVYDMLTQTQAAMPTNTIIPPTNTPLPLEPTATFTTVPTLSTEIASPTPPTEIASPTAVLVATSNTVSCADQPLSGWTGDSVPLSVTNNVKGTTANVFLCIVTAAGEIGYISIPVDKSGSASVPLGDYSATAWVSGKKDFNATTTFQLKNTASVQLVIENNSIILRAGCAPNC